jgi:hypothetical protein
MNANIKLEFSNLKCKHFTLQETYKERKEEYMSNEVKNNNEFKIDIEKVENNLHQIIGKQFEITNDTFSLKVGLNNTAYLFCVPGWWRSHATIHHAATISHDKLLTIALCVVQLNL